ncbi:MAG: hypothetical protein EOM19_06545 [Candidatus Moranbacteria bacterium]|nr:hypothetical protein [Candidatus Moranbacteria bacterium]
MKQEFLKDRTDTIRMTDYENNRPRIPASATITLFDPYGKEIQASTSASVNATTGEMTYSLTATHTAKLGLNYRALWTYVISGVTIYEEQLFDVVRSRLSIPITDDDLYDELNVLRKANAQNTGTATAATSTTLVDTVNLKEDDDFWTGGRVEILAGTGAGQVRDITDFVQSTGTITVDPAWTTTPDTTSVYRVVRSYTRQIQQAFIKLTTMIYNKGQRHALIIESAQIKVPMIYLTIHTICLDLMDNVDDKWHRLAEMYQEKFNNSFDTMKLDYDADESGTIEDEEQARTVSELRVFRG